MKTQFNKWWVALWAGDFAALMAAIPFVTVRQWVAGAAVAFGLPELIGIFHRGDSLPPLTYVIRRYVPRWLTFAAIPALTAAAGAWWLGFGRWWALGALFALDGWVRNHFDVTYDGPGE